MKIFKKLKKKLKQKTVEYAQKDINELSRILNRPQEGEVVKINNIKIRSDFSKPNPKKFALRKIYYEKYHYFRSQIVLSKNNYLVDGYTTYLIAKEKGFDYITIVRTK